MGWIKGALGSKMLQMNPRERRNLAGDLRKLDIFTIEKSSFTGESPGTHLWHGY
jgi:hypothetical protein